MSFDIPPSIIALLPSVLQLLERVLDRIGFIGNKTIRTQIKLDKRPVIKSTFVTPQNGPAILDAVETYFTFNERANEIIKLHLSFMLSLYLGSVEKSADPLKLEGWYVGGLLIVILSFIIFIFAKLLRSSPTDVHPFPGWGVWTWAMFVMIVVAEGMERLLKT
jgi:hypothetical protein